MRESASCEVVGEALSVVDGLREACGGHGYKELQGIRN